MRNDLITFQNRGVLRAIEHFGSQTNLAKALGCTQPLIGYWLNNTIPVNRVIQLESLTGIHRSYFRPDLFSKK